MSRHHRRKHRFKLRSLYVWHRYLGVSIALFVLLISTTGLFLNHTEAFRLDSRHVKNAWVLDWYGIKAPESLLSFDIDDRHITLMGEHLYLDQREIPGQYRRLVGALRLGELYAVAVSDSILLLTREGDIVERLRTQEGVPAGVSAIGVDTDGHLVVASSHDIYQADRNFLKWQRVDTAQEVAWAQPSALEASLATELRAHYREEVLPLERVVLDLHSGRFFGKAGPWVFDVVAIVLMLLALSGTWIWLRRRR